MTQRTPRWRGRQWLAVLVSNAAVFGMLAPTFPLRWAAPPPEEGPTTWHSWADPVVFGHLLFPPVLLAAAFLAAAIGWFGIILGRATQLPTVFCALAVLGGIGCFSLVGVQHPMWVVPTALMLLAAVLHGWAARGSRAEAREQARVAPVQDGRNPDPTTA